MRRRRRCRPRAAGQPTARDRRRSHSRRAFLLAMQPAAGAVDACPAGWPSRCAGRMISPASISADSTAPQCLRRQRIQAGTGRPGRGNLPSLQVRFVQPRARRQILGRHQSFDNGRVAATGSGSPCPTCPRTAQAVARPLPAPARRRQNGATPASTGFHRVQLLIHMPPPCSTGVAVHCNAAPSCSSAAPRLPEHARRANPRRAGDAAPRPAPDAGTRRCARSVPARGGRLPGFQNPASGSRPRAATRAGGRRAKPDLRNAADGTPRPHGFHPRHPLRVAHLSRQQNLSRQHTQINKGAAARTASV